LNTKENEVAKQWATKHKQFLYMLGYTFIEDEIVIEEVLRQTINTFKGSEEFNKEQFKLTFVKKCLSQKLSSSHTDILAKMPASYRHCLFLRYVLQISPKEIALYLSISEKHVEEYLLLGLEALVAEEIELKGSQLSVQTLLNYHQGLVSFTEYKDINNLLVEKEVCSQILEKLIDIFAELQNLRDNLKPSPYFLEANRPLTEKQIKRKKYRQRSLTAVMSFILLISILIGSIGVDAIQHKWKVWTAEAVGYGEPVYMSAVDQDIEIIITHVAADNSQTILYYEIHDLNTEVVDEDDDYQFTMMENRFELIDKEIWEEHHSNSYSAPRHFQWGRITEYPNQGRLILPALKNQSEIVTVRFYSLEQVKKGIDMFYGYDSSAIKNVRGEWVIDVPVTKYEPITVDIDQTVEIMGEDIYFSHLEIAPTGSLLLYNIDESMERGDHELYSSHKTVGYEYHELHFSHIEDNEKIYYPDYYLHRFIEEDQLGKWNRMFPFESVYYAQPRELEVIFDRMVSNYGTEMEVAINYEQLPMEFSFLDTMITIKEVEKTTYGAMLIKMEEEVDIKRSYDQFHLSVHQDEGNYYGGYGHSTKGIWIDKQGNQYHSYEEIMDTGAPYELKYISTEVDLEIYINEQEWNESMLPEKFIIHGYSRTEFLNERLKINLK
jgi:hypothetical protein